MLITKVEREYSKSINTKNYGLPESWIKVGAIYEAKIESGDDPVHCSAILYDAVKNDVIANVNQLIEKMRASLNPTQVITPAPIPTVVAPVAPVTPVATPPVAPIVTALINNGIPVTENPETGEITINATPAELFPDYPVSGEVKPAATPASVAGIQPNPLGSPRPL